MIEPANGKPEAGGDVFTVEIRKLRYHLGGRQAAASRSSTSLTRIRIPRTQGRPPHWSGFTVIRSISSTVWPTRFAPVGTT